MTDREKEQLAVIGVLLLAIICLLVVVGFNLDGLQEDAVIAPQVEWTNSWLPLTTPPDACTERVAAPPLFCKPRLTTP